MPRILTVLLLLTAACRHPADVAPAPAWSQTEIGLTVVNHNWSDARIYLLHDGVTQRLGLVGSASEATFMLSGRNFASGATVRLRATLVGNSRPVITDPILVQPDQVITWTIELSLAHSTLVVQ
ncbi:MAG: hypothetical protein ABI765_12425 [Gemmatimonadota bacterium]